LIRPSAAIKQHFKPRSFVASGAYNIPTETAHRIRFGGPKVQPRLDWPHLGSEAVLEIRRAGFLCSSDPVAPLSMLLIEAYNDAVSEFKREFRITGIPA